MLGMHKPRRNWVHVFALTLAVLTVVFSVQIIAHSHANGQNEAACQLCQVAHIIAPLTEGTLAFHAPLVEAGFVVANPSFPLLLLARLLLALLLLPLLPLLLLALLSTARLLRVQSRQSKTTERLSPANSSEAMEFEASGFARVSTLFEADFSGNITILAGACTMLFPFC